MRKIWDFKWGRIKDESGYVLIMALFVILILSLIGVALTVVGIQEYTISSLTKLMDQSYAIADAGVNRAAVHIQLNPDLTKTTSPAYPTAQYGPASENFGGGQFTYSIYQSNIYPSDPTMKIIRSTGKITRGGKTSERTIEAQIQIGAGSEEYDASFDYCIYNGNSDSGGTGTWPSVLRFGGYISGNYYFDGLTPYEGRSPKGAVYTKGSIQIPVWLLGDIIYKGNIVATDNIEIRNTWHADWNDPGIQIQNGRAIAGLDGTGNLSVKVAECIAATKPALSIPSPSRVVAAGDITIDTLVNASLSNVLEIGDVKAGGNVRISGTFNISQAMQIGNVISGGKTTVESRWLNGINVGNIWAGQAADGLGVDLDTEAASKITVAGITSRGKVNAEADVAGISTANIIAGNDITGSTGGIGVRFKIAWLSGTSVGTIISTGRVNLEAVNISNITTGSIYAGADAGGTGVYWQGNVLSSIDCGDVYSVGCVYANLASGSDISIGLINCESYVYLTGKEWSSVSDDIIVDGAIKAKDYVKITGYDDIMVYGAITTESWVWIKDYYGSFSLGNVRIYGNVWADTEICPDTGYTIRIENELWQDCDVHGSIMARGPIRYLSTQPGVTGEGDTYIDGGLWGTSVKVTRDWGGGYGDLYVGKISGSNDSIRSTGNVECKGAGDVFDDDIILGGGSGDIRYNGSTDIDDTDYGSTFGGYTSLPDAPNLGNLVTTPAKPNPVYVDRNGVFDEPGPAGQNKNVDVLAEAGLHGTVDLLEPNWEYFETMAKQDDASNPGAPHMIYDGGAGDKDGVVNDEIKFQWDTTTPYSTNETVYNGDPDVSIVINKLDWTGRGPKFTGTLVSRGSIYMSCSSTDWTMEQEETLNLVSGYDISSKTAGLTVWENPNCHYHWWAEHNIDISNMRFSLGGGQTYYGSFTAGNTVMYADNSFWPDSTFRWSRWELDPVAWAPPFDILVWKEI
ncbi:MAG: hypothetical protein PHP64_01055 [Actinomycetota bacterium]|nr:hypothetical protein [Actinomycetota bacterium]